MALQTKYFQINSCFTNHNSSYTHLKISSTYKNCDKLVQPKNIACVLLISQTLVNNSSPSWFPTSRLWDSWVAYFCCTLCTLTSQGFTCLEELLHLFISMRAYTITLLSKEKKEQNVPNTMLTSFICFAHFENDFILTIPIICYLR